MAQKGDEIIPYGYIYKVTFPNGKIYVGRDTGRDAESAYYKYFGSPISKAKLLMHQELGPLLGIGKKLTVTKEILYEARDCTVSHIMKKEREYIKAAGSTDREIGYNF